MRNILLTIMLLSSAGIFLSFWLSPPEAFLQKPVSDTEELPKADSYMLNINKTAFNKKGSKAYHLKATEGRHFTHRNRLELDQPQIVSYDQDNPDSPWRITSATGTAFNGGERVVLKGDVYAWQPLKDNNKNELRTEKLILFPDKHIAETDLKVTIVTPKGTTVGIGMWSDLNQSLFRLLSRVRGLHYAH